MKESSKGYTVKQLAALAGVTVRTLHYYDEIGLLKPTTIAQNGYRYYAEPALLRLQQILFYRELGLDLQQIREILAHPGFDLISGLQRHRQVLEDRINRLFRLIVTVDTTILHLTGEVQMSKKKLFEGFSEEKQKEYETEAAQQWGEENVRGSIQLWKSYTEEKKKAIMDEGGAIYQAIIADMGKGPDSAEIQEHLAQWHQHLRNFYEPSFEVLRGLGDHYHDNPDFNATFTAMHPDLPGFLNQAINVYVDALETAWLERELGILKE